jgi:methylamine---glutamate N-methyltransferase subunit A
MCGIVGYFHKRSDDEPIGDVLLEMLNALARRGPDSAGVALFGPREPRGEICWIKLPEEAAPEESEAIVLRRLASTGRTLEQRRVGFLVRAVIERSGTVRELCERVERDGFEVVSLGRRLELVKQVGAPGNLSQSLDIGRFRGSHGIGHTRLSTESKVDLSHSQPFWARGLSDLATVHNGHITNYDRLKRMYEQRGYRFFTQNDSEVIAVYIADNLAKGRSFEETLRSSLDDLDGSFTYLAATADEFGYARDPFAFKPLITVETPDAIAIANEEIAIRTALGDEGVAHEPTGHVYRVWRRATARKGVAA